MEKYKLKQIKSGKEHTHKNTQSNIGYMAQEIKKQCVFITCSYLTSVT
jgi:hypothetical protein